MRYQELIYIQNQNSAVRNKSIPCISMSSDICIFESPIFSMSGASKINCTGFTGTTYIITTATTIPVVFDFTANTNTFTANTASFKYEVYKFNNNTNTFSLPPVYQSEIINYSGFSGTNITNESIPITNLNLDGEYIIKGYYEFDTCTNFLNLLGKKIDTLTYRNGSEYGLYNNYLDYYFIAVKSADIPVFLVNGSNTPTANQLYQQVILPTTNQPTIRNNFSGNIILTLNGLVLYPMLDYVISGSSITLNSDTVSGDVITLIYTTSGGNSLVGDNTRVNSSIISGTTNNQGANNPYYNLSTNKYEVYTTVTPATGGSIILMLNGATLANGIDFYQSSSDPKRIILEGDLRLGDLITIIYFPVTSVVNGLVTSTPTISWQITTPPELENGLFTLEVSTGNTFSSIYTSGITNYIVGKTQYSDTITISGTVGTTLYYRVRNDKNYETLCGDIINTYAYSETIPVIIQTNGINTY